MVERVSGSIIRAAGGVLWRTANASSGPPRIEVAVIHRPRYDDWSIPKGKLVPGESEIEGAIREVTEETGYRVQIRRPLGEVSYQKGSGADPRTKTVRYWSMHAEGGLFSPSREVDQLRWLSIEDAYDLLSHERDRALLRTFAEGPVLTRAVLLLRHASAGNRSAWSGDESSLRMATTGTSAKRWTYCEGAAPTAPRRLSVARAVSSPICSDVWPKKTRLECRNRSRPRRVASGRLPSPAKNSWPRNTSRRWHRGSCTRPADS